MKRVRSLSRLIILISSFLFTSCASVENNSVSVISKTFRGEEILHEGINRIYIEKISNGNIDSSIPVTLESSLKRRINIEGRLTVVDDISASDAILRVRIVKVISEPFDYDSSGRPGKKRIRIDSAVSLIYTRTGLERISRSEVYADDVYSTGGASTASEYREISGLTDKLSEKIISVIYTGWYREK